MFNYSPTLNEKIRELIAEFDEDVDYTPRFTVHSFNYTVNINLNLEAAKCLYNLVRGVDQVDPVLYAMSEKIKHQFFRMKKLEILEDEQRNEHGAGRVGEVESVTA
jgi:hypothetical protein